jgi:hypothetical protein
MLDELGVRLGNGRASRLTAAVERLDSDGAEQVLCALAVNRFLEPPSKITAVRGTAERVALRSFPNSDDHNTRARTDFLLEALEKITGQIF